MLASFAGRFGRVEPRRTAAAFVTGLLADIEVKTCWQLAEQAGHARPDAMQRLLYRAVWDAEAVRDDLRTVIVDRFGDPDAVLVVDETGDLKKGVHSVGVQRQYTGTAGRIENAQVGVFLGYASGHGHTLVDRRVYLPVSWTEDRDRCQGAGVPDEVKFATKSELAADMITAAVDAGVPAAWAAADEAYGNSSVFRAHLRQHRLGYVLAVSRSHLVPLDGGKVRLRADRIAADLPASAWQRRSAGAGSKGPRFYDWAWLDDVTTDVDPDDSGRHSLLVRKNTTSGELAFYRCWTPQPATLAQLVRVAGIRWTVEESLCATRRLVVSPTQLGGTRREVSGSEWLTRSRKVNGDKSMPGNQRPGPGVRGGAMGDPRDMAKAGLPEAQSPVDVTSHPPERRLKPVPRSAAVMKHSRSNLRIAKRCPARAFKEMSGPPTSRSNVRQGRTWDRLRDASVGVRPGVQS
ncbi:IS701 family transposase [Micromonospora sediminicola]|uniref:IS701 family transposase n=1 Tax=Micromonospora sediminicola TaxID=946078 RepID=UPI0037AF077B